MHRIIVRLREDSYQVELGNPEHNAAAAETHHNAQPTVIEQFEKIHLHLSPLVTAIRTYRFLLPLMGDRSRQKDEERAMLKNIFLREQRGGSPSTLHWMAGAAVGAILVGGAGLLYYRYHYCGSSDVF